MAKPSNGFLYYVPSPDKVSIEAVGLSYAFEAAPTQLRITNGPGGTEGHLLFEGDLFQGVGPGFHPDKQTWRKRPPRPGDDGGPLPELHAGYFNEAAPTPRVLVRDVVLAGHVVHLGDGHDYTVPVARQYDFERLEDGSDRITYTDKLPPKLELDEDTGEWVVGSPVEKYAALWDVACRWYDALFEDTAIEEAEEGSTAAVAFDRPVESAVAVLSANYRLDSIEASLLNLLDMERVRQVLDAVIDQPALASFVKKKRLGT